MSSSIRSVCLFCSASDRIAPHYLEQGYLLGEMLAKKKLELVFGGGNCGLMGATAKASLAHGGQVTGVFPDVLEGIEPMLPNVTKLIQVPDMHTRKYTMFTLADAFIILPGGFGTMDETFEIITWKQLHTHNKPVIFYNYQGYWDHWLALTRHFIAEGFAQPKSETLYTVVNTLEDIFTTIEHRSLS